MTPRIRHFDHMSSHSLRRSTTGPIDVHAYESERRRKLRPFDSIWKKFIGTVALLDFLSTLMARRYFEDPETITAHFRIFSQNYLIRFDFLKSSFSWLSYHNTMFGFLFSILWTVDAFQVADRHADLALAEWERRNFLHTVGVERHKSISARTKDEMDEQLKKPTLNLLDKYKQYVFFFAALLWQFLLLPVGFYLLIFKFLRWNNAARSPDEMKALLESTYHEDNLPAEYRSFSNETMLSLGFAVAKHTGIAVAKIAKIHRKKMKKRGIREGLKLGFAFALHPFQTWKHSQKLLYIIRWIKYIIPLIGYGLKIRSSCRTVIVSYMQRRRQKRAESFRRKQWRQMTENQRRERAAKRIQSTYRSYCERQACFRMMEGMKIQGDEAARRLQLALRSMLERARAKEQKKKRELEKLERKRRHSIRFGRNVVGMNEKEQARLKELRMETKPEIRRFDIDSHLLMRPDSGFQKVWAIFYFTLTFLEIVAHLSNVHMAKRAQKSESNVPTVSLKLQNLLIPDPVADLKECSCVPSMKRFFKRSQPDECGPFPWYCEPTYAMLQQTYSRAVLVLIERIVTVMGFVFFLDCPVFFFTGRYHPETGVLISRPWFRRWVMPGIIMQMIINPQLEKTAKVAVKIAKSSMEGKPSVLVFSFRSPSSYCA